MWRKPAIVGIVFLVSARAGAVCPVVVVTGVGDSDGIAVTFRNLGKLPIRQLEFDCQWAQSRPRTSACREANALFYPGVEYTVRYPYPGGQAATVTLAVKSVTTSDGLVWRPSKRQPCRSLRIMPHTPQSTH